MSASTASTRIVLAANTADACAAPTVLAARPICRAMVTGERPRARPHGLPVSWRFASAECVARMRARAVICRRGREVSRRGGRQRRAVAIGSARCSKRRQRLVRPVTYIRRQVPRRRRARVRCERADASLRVVLMPATRAGSRCERGLCCHWTAFSHALTTHAKAARLHIARARQGELGQPGPALRAGACNARALRPPTSEAGTRRTRTRVRTQKRARKRTPSARLSTQHAVRATVRAHCANGRGIGRTPRPLTFA